MEPYRNKRYAFEWFMRKEDKRYWEMAQEMMRKTEKKMEVLNAISTATAGIALTISAVSLIRKSA